MRSFLKGLIFLLLLSTGFVSVAHAQADGFVESIGFQGYYRPNCWTPMVINLSSQISEPAEYQVRVYQEDLDRDHAIYQRTITLNPKVREKFQVYFIPQPTNGGLPETSQGGVSVADL